MTPRQSHVTVLETTFSVSDVTVAAIDPTSCEILDAVSPLLTPGPGVNVTTTITTP